MLEFVKLTLRISTDAFDTEIQSLIDSAYMDLKTAGVVITGDNEEDAIVKTAVATYVKANFGSSSEYERLKRSYDEQKSQLATHEGYTDWGDD